MRIAIFGTGGAGGYFGAQLARAGEDVVFIARGEHLKAIQQHGLRLEKAGEEFVVRAPATDDPRKVSGVDVVLLGVKTWQVATAAVAMRPMISAATVVVPLQNGVEAADQLATALGSEHVLGGLCGTISWIVSPGQIRSIGETHFIKFGELDNQKRERVERLRDAFERAGVNVEVPADIQVALWQKFVFGAPFGGVGAVTRSPAGTIRSLPETRRMLEDCMREIVAVARARHIGLPSDAIGKSLAIIDGLDPSAITSLQRDIVSGKPSELDGWTGAVVRLGRDAGVPTPVNEFIYHSLLPGELRARETRGAD
jgi:2-dehydropantoate 2-reductase